MLRNAAALLIASAALASCARIAPVTEAVAAAPKRVASGTVEFFQNVFSAPQSAVEAIEIGRSQQCNSQGRESVVNLFTNVSQLKDWETSRGVQLTPVTASLPGGSYAIVEMGERNTGGYALAVSRQAAKSGDALYLKASYLSPKTSGMATQVLTAPCALVAIRSNDRFASATLLDQTNKVRAQWTLATASAPSSEPPPPPVPAPAPETAPEALPVEKLSPQVQPAASPDEPQQPRVEDLPLPVRTPMLTPVEPAPPAAPVEPEPR